MRALVLALVACGPPRGFTIHTGCKLGVSSVVTTAGAPFPWIADDREEVREKFRSEAVWAAGHSIEPRGDGFGGGCTPGTPAFHIYVPHGADLRAAQERIGRWLVRRRWAGEVLFVEMGEPHRL